MKHLAIVAALMLGGTGVASAAVVAEKAVTQNGYTVRLQLLDEQVAGPMKKFVKCKFGNNLARLSSEVAGAPQTNELQALGCWVVNRDGVIEFSAVDRQTGKPIYVKTEVDQYATSPAFKSWDSYMGAFMLTNTGE